MYIPIGWANGLLSCRKPQAFIKKAPLRRLSDKWCAILCNYRTNEYDDFKELIRKIELFEDSVLK